MTFGATNELDKARKLFEALSRHIDPGFGGSRTAEQVYDSWDDPKASFRCQEYSRLYMALARSVGLSAFFVSVQKDFRTNDVIHACIAVCFNDNALLVDPAYHWFGVPHQEFLVVDDLQALADYLHQQNDDIPLDRIAVKLDPDSAFAHHQLICALLNECFKRSGGQREITDQSRLIAQRAEAKLLLHKALRLDPDSYQANYVKGVVAAAENDAEQAEISLRQSCEQNPRFDKANYLLAQVLQNRGKLKEALTYYHAFLDCATEAGGQPEARHAIAEINEQLAAGPSLR